MPPSVDLIMTISQTRGIQTVHYIKKQQRVYFPDHDPVAIKMRMVSSVCLHTTVISTAVHDPHHSYSPCNP